MIPRPVLGLLLALAILVVGAPAGAVGPLDGSYITSVTLIGEETVETVTWYVVVLQRNDTEFGMAVLDSFDTGSWVYGFGTLDGTLRVTGPVLFPDGGDFGQFDFRFQGGSLTGTITPLDLGMPLTLKGDKFF